MIPQDELTFTFTRSSGPGGQNVNRRSTRAQVRWNVARSAKFTDEQKARIRRAAGKRLSAEDDIVIAAEGERSQAQNRDEAVARLERLIADALVPRKPRVPTKASRTQRRKRLEAKRRVSEKKSARRRQAGEW